MEDVFSKADFTGSNNVGLADQVHFYDGTTFRYYWLVHASTLYRWVAIGDATLKDYSGRIMPPGEGYLLRIRGSSPSALVRSAGVVRQGPFRLPVAAGQWFHSLGHPVASTPVTNHLQAADGFVHTNNPATADRLQIWRGDATLGNTSYDGYWYFSGGGSPYYAKQGDATLANFNNTLLFPLHRAFFTKANTAKPDRVVLCPWTP